MDSTKFDEVLKTGGDLADSFRDHSEAAASVESAKEDLERAQRVLNEALSHLKTTAQIYEEAKLALIGSVEAL